MKFWIHVKKRLFFNWCGNDRIDKVGSLLMKNRDAVQLYDFCAKTINRARKYGLLNDCYHQSPELNTLFSYVTAIILAIQAPPLVTNPILDYKNF